MRIGLNVGLTIEQLREFSEALAVSGHGEAAPRLTMGLDKVAAEKKHEAVSDGGRSGALTKALTGSALTNRSC